MKQYDSILKMYGKSGLRTIEDWTARGRDIAADAPSRLDTPYRGKTVPLFSRDQTTKHVSARLKKA